MPIYEYECNSCGHRLETIQGFDDAPLTDCPSCQKADLTKLLSAPAFHLKGNGWYVTDFKNSTTCKQDKSPDGDVGGGCGAGECKSQAKDSDKTAPTA